MVKLYKNIDEVLHYHEAWTYENIITEHWGEVGSKGSNREYPVDPKLTEDDNLRHILKPVYEQDYKEIDIDDHVLLILEYKIDDFGSPDDLSKRNSLEDKLNNLLGWTGLGECDGGSIGSGTMEVACFVVDYSIAETMIVDALRETECADYSRIYQME
ncbi:MAG TPA: hypothetical protein ENI73_05500 [Spirochaetes bacterium]|nr:hypothetical protein [Spirochaetota bacterium]